MQPDVESMQRALTDAIRGASAAQTIGADMAGYLRSHGATENDVRANSDATSASRFLLYRSLIHHRFRSAIEVSIPRTLARLGEARTAEVLDGFLSERASHSHYMRDVASEFVDYCEQAWISDQAIPTYLIELARHELLLFEVPAAEDDLPRQTEASIDLERSLCFQKAARLVRYGHSVHRISDEQSDRCHPKNGDFALLAYRDSNHEVRCLELSSVAAAVVQRLLDGEPLREAIQGGCSDTRAATDDSTLAELAVFLEDLEQRGVLR